MNAPAALNKPRVVLYNPRAPFFTMPLALLAIGSALDRSRYDVTIVDGRLERDPVARVLEATDGALCLGISVLTGTPIRDALAVTEAILGAALDRELAGAIHRDRDLGASKCILPLVAHRDLFAFAA